MSFVKMEELLEILRMKCSWKTTVQLGERFPFFGFTRDEIDTPKNQQIITANCGPFWIITSVQPEDVWRPSSTATHDDSGMIRVARTGRRKPDRTAENTGGTRKPTRGLLQEAI